MQPAVYWRRYELTSKETMKTVNLGEIPVCTRGIHIFLTFEEARDYR